MSKHALIVNMPSSSSVARRGRPRGSRSSGSSSCGKKMMGCGSAGGVSAVLQSESVYAMSGETAACPKAVCPTFTGPIIFLAVLFLFWVSMMWAFKPTFALKAGVPRSNPNSVDLTAGMLYSLLFTGLVLVIIGLVVRCRACM